MQKNIIRVGQKTSMPEFMQPADDMIKNWNYLFDKTDLDEEIGAIFFDEKNNN